MRVRIGPPVATLGGEDVVEGVVAAIDRRFPRDVPVGPQEVPAVHVVRRVTRLRRSEARVHVADKHVVRCRPERVVLNAVIVAVAGPVRLVFEREVLGLLSRVLRLELRLVIGGDALEGLGGVDVFRADQRDAVGGERTLIVRSIDDSRAVSR